LDVVVVVVVVVVVSVGVKASFFQSLKSVAFSVVGRASVEQFQFLQSCNQE